MTAWNDRFDLSDARWRKTGYSDRTGTACLEVAEGFHPALVPVRGSKDPHGPAPVFTATAWEAFMDGVKSGDFGA
ncbi:DUF397 domain-containing protein [Streptomyces sp. B22F1]|uniref:DUF397 domain-containing protein n=1 Tax=Streptomyces sp. B22F1 TaxID=3153566 RepID=UPI00325EC229